MFIPKILTYPYLVSRLERRYLHQNLPICRCKFKQDLEAKNELYLWSKKGQRFLGLR